MIIDNSEQGTDEWLMARLGIPTTSNFSKIFGASGKPSTQAKGYMNSLLADYIAGYPVDQIDKTEWMARGNELEGEARDTYCFLTDNDVEQVGLVYLDEKKLVGCSPDGLVGDHGLNEIKCPKASTLVEYLLNGKLPSTYKPQVQGQLWVTGREWCDFFAYHPDIETQFLLRVYRDEKYISGLSDAVLSFVGEMLEKREKLSKLKD